MKYVDMPDCNKLCSCGKRCQFVIEDHEGECECDECRPGICPQCNHDMSDHNHGPDYVNAEIHVVYKCWFDCDILPGRTCGCEHGKPVEKPSLSFYLIRDKSGKYYTTGSKANYRGGGRDGHWVTKIEDAKIYSLGQARGQVTRLGKDLDVVEFKAIEVKVLDEKARIVELNKSKKTAADKFSALRKASAILEAEKDLADAKAKLDNLTGKTQTNKRCNNCGHAPHGWFPCPDETLNGYSCRCTFRG